LVGAGFVDTVRNHIMGDPSVAWVMADDADAVGGFSKLDRDEIRLVGIVYAAMGAEI
jgi:hypothetical protein